jgi:hypothetical protein
MMFFSTIFEIVNPMRRIAASMRKEILMMTSVRRPKLIFLNSHIFFILRELMLVVVEAGIDTR